MLYDELIAPAVGHRRLEDSFRAIAEAEGKEV